jgi:hypothetical protein
MALIGGRVGEELCWASAAGPTVAKVLRLVHQPEAAMRRVLGDVSTRRNDAPLFSRN